MKKKVVSLLMVFTLTAAVLAGCNGKKEASGKSEAPKEEPATVEASEEEAIANRGNPWVDITEDEAKKCCARLFKVPDGAKDPEWLKCEELGDPDKGIGPVVQLSFEYDGLYFTARAQQGADENDDISGIYTDWTVGPEDATLAYWGEGNMAGKTYRSINDSGYIDLITWYDVEIGIMYSLSVSSDDLDGFDIQAVAEQMYAGE